LASKLHAAGVGQVLAEQPILQDRAYWEVTVEGEGCPHVAVGVVSRAHNLGEQLGDGATSWSLDSRELLGPLRDGDVLGVALNQSDYPVSIRFFLNGAVAPNSPSSPSSPVCCKRTAYHRLAGVQCSELTGPSTEATPIIQLASAGAAVAANFGGTDFVHDVCCPAFECVP